MIINQNYVEDNYNRENYDTDILLMVTGANEND